MWRLQDEIARIKYVQLHKELEISYIFVSFNTVETAVKNVLYVLYFPKTDIYTALTFETHTSKSGI